MFGGPGMRRGALFYKFKMAAWVNFKHLDLSSLFCAVFSYGKESICRLNEKLSKHQICVREKRRRTCRRREEWNLLAHFCGEPMSCLLVEEPMCEFCPWKDYLVSRKMIWVVYRFSRKLGTFSQGPLLSKWGSFAPPPHPWGIWQHLETFVVLKTGCVREMLAFCGWRAGRLLHIVWSIGQLSITQNHPAHNVNHEDPVVEHGLSVWCP